MKAPCSEAYSPPPPNSSDVTSQVLLGEFRRNFGQISRQSAVFFLGTLFTMAVGYFVKIYVARILGAEQLGLYALGMTLVSLTQLVGAMGLPATIARYVAIYNSSGRLEELRAFLTRSVSIMALLNLVLSVGLAFGGAWIAQKFYHAPGLGQYMVLFATIAWLGALNLCYSQVLAGFKDVARRTVITNFIGSPLVFALTILLLALGGGMRGYLVAQVITALVVVVLLIVVARRLTPVAARFSFAPLKRLDPEIKSFAAAALGMAALDFLVSQADKVMVGFYLNPRLVGIYVLASTLSAFIALVLQSVNQIFAPIIADLHAQGQTGILQKLFQTLTKWILGFILPIALVMIIFSHQFMRLFGAEFEAGWPILVIGAVGQVVNCGVGSVGYLLLMSGNQRRLMRVQFFMTVISLLMNIALIPAFGIVGAALASACVNVASNLWNLSEVRKALRIFPYNRGYSALLIPTTVVAAALSVLRMGTDSMAHQWLVIFFAVFLACALFAILALAYALDPDDRMIVRSAWAQLRMGMRRLGVAA